MERKAIRGIMLTLLLVSMFSMAFNAVSVRADPAIIRVPTDYPTIQEAINAANPGDTINVSSGTYYENVVVNKSVSLFGQSRDSTFIDGNEIGVVVYVTADYVNISGFTIQNSGAGGPWPYPSGILLDHSNSCTINGNIVTSNERGVYLYYSEGSTIIGNTIQNNVGNSFLIKYSSNNTVVNNKVTNNTRGILLSYSGKNIFRDNNLTGNRHNFHVSGSSLSHFIQDIDTSNTIDGKPIYYWVNEHNKQIPADAGYVAIINSTNITVRDLNMTNNGEGVLMVYTNDSIIENVNALNNFVGIYTLGSNNVTISGNTVTNNVDGVFMKNSNKNVIVDNTILDNRGTGIRLWTSGNNTINGNIIVSNGWLLHGFPFGGWGIYAGGSSNGNIISGNTISNNLYTGIDIREGSSHNTINGNTIINNSLVGVSIYGSSNHNVISGNIIKRHGYRGISVTAQPRENIILGNTVTSNGRGIELWESYSNTIYHNNFINNTEQVRVTNSFDNTWDDGYPSGGNYWSDYSDVDLYSGPYQNEAGSDGIWDHPYTIDANNQDRYPLVNSWTPVVPFITATVNIDPDTLNLKSKGEWITCYIELPESYNVSDIDVSTILLNDTVPAEWSDIQDDVLMVKFNRTDVISLLNVGNQTIKITGQLTDGTPFEGTDMIRAIHAQITLSDLRTIRLNVNGAFLQGENLKVRFYSYFGTYQGEITIWNGTTPTQIILTQDTPSTSPIENAALVLTNSEGKEILNLASLLVSRTHLFTRITQIDTEWTYASPEERTAIFQETIDIDMQWPYALP